MQLIFRERQQPGGLDLEAVEMAMRSTFHQAGAAALSERLEYHPPEVEGRMLSCPCGHAAVYRGLRAKTILTALGEVEFLRPYFLCSHCGHGQFPADIELEIENTARSPHVSPAEPSTSSPSVRSQEFRYCNLPSHSRPN